jgi:hypothetical protein
VSILNSLFHFVACLAYAYFLFILAGKVCPNLSLEQQGQFEHILAFSQLPTNADQMSFSNIVTDSALREHLGYQILVDKVAWDHQGNPKKPIVSIDKKVFKSPAQS